MNTPTHPDTRHLDTAISILGGGRAKRKAPAPQIHLVTLNEGVSVQVNGREVWLAPSMDRAREDAVRRADTALRLKGVRPQILEY